MPTPDTAAELAECRAILRSIGNAATDALARAADDNVIWTEAYDLTLVLERIAGDVDTYLGKVAAADAGQTEMAL